MAINIPSGLNITTKEPVDIRLTLTKQEMRDVIDSRFPDKYFCLCKDDGKLYIYDSANSVDSSIGKFRLYLKDELADKQDKLTAGENITIKNNVISSVGGGKVYTAGNNIQISDTNVISATDTVYDDSEIRGELSGLQTDVDGLQTQVGSLETQVVSLGTQVSSLGTLVDSLDGQVSSLNTQVTDLDAKVDSAIETTTEEIGRLEGEIDGLNTKVEKDEGDITNLQADVTEIKDDIDNIKTNMQPKLIAGENITITEDNVISSTGSGSTLTQKLVVGYDVGGIKSGTEYPVGTQIEEILRQLLIKNTPVGTDGIYTGIVNSIPTSITGLTKHEKDKADLLASGYIFEVNTNNQYAVLAIDKALGLKVKKIEVSGFSMGFNEKDIGDQYLYHFDDPTYDEDAEYVYTFKEV